jgi:hypothetical protein
VVDPEERFADQLAMHQDSTNLRGKAVFEVILGSGAITNAGVFNPAFFGVRCTALAAIFTRWRIKELVIKMFFESSGNAPGANVGFFGILDDSSGAEGDAPTTYEGLLACRTSGMVGISSLPIVRVYKPVDKKKWYYTYAGATGSDPRLTSVGVLYVAQTGVNGTGVFVQVDYSLSFAGANDIGATVTLKGTSSGPSVAAARTAPTIDEYITVHTPSMRRGLPIS